MRWLKQSQEDIERETEEKKGNLLLQYSRIINFVYSEITEYQTCLVVAFEFVRDVYRFVMGELVEYSSQPR